jgi:hypothetical protein
MPDSIDNAVQNNMTRNAKAVTPAATVDIVRALTQRERPNYLPISGAGASYYAMAKDYSTSLPSVQSASGRTPCAHPSWPSDLPDTLLLCED